MENGKTVSNHLNLRRFEECVSDIRCTVKCDAQFFRITQAEKLESSTSAADVIIVQVGSKVV